MKLFSASFNVAPAAAATDIFEFAPAAGKVYRIQKIILSGIQATGGMVLFNLLKRSTAATGGASTNATYLDQEDITGVVETPTCTCKIFTANPTTGTLINNVRIVRIPIPAATSPVDGIVVMNFGPEGLLIQGSEFLCGNLGGATLAGGSISVNIEFNQ